MGMNGCYLRVPAAELSRLRGDAAFLRDLTRPKRSLGPLSGPLGIPWWLKIMMWTVNRNGWREMKRAASDRVGDSPSLPAWERLDIGKSWHALHWILCRQAEGGPEPLIHATANGGGEAIGPDIGYGPACLVEPSKVAAAAAALRPFTSVALQSRFDSAEMDGAGLYPGGFQEDALEWREEIDSAFGDVRDFYGRAAAAGDAVLLWLD